MKKLWMLVGVLFLVGCGLTAQQRVTLLEAERRIAAYRPKVAAIVERVRNGELPIDEAAALIAEYTENEAVDKELARKLRSQDIPWWAFLVMGAPTIAGAVGLKKYIGIVKVVKGLILGVETSCDKEAKSTIRDVAVDAGIQPELDAIVGNMGLKKGTT